jgi:hypothetical protein
MIRWAAAMIFLLLLPLARAEGGDSIRVCFDASSAKWVALPDGFPDSELDVLEDVDGRYKAVVVDLKGDGGQEYFFPTACGNGGCDYPIFDRRSNRLLGNVFGSPVCILRETVNRMPVLQTYTHAGPSAKIIRYVFDGKKYQVKSSVEMEGEEHDAVVEQMKKAPFLRDIAK